MTIKQRLGRVFRNLFSEEQLFNTHSFTLLRNQGDGTLRTPYAQNAWVHRAANAIAVPISSTPFLIEEGDEEEPTLVADSNDARAQQITKLFDDPNPNMTKARLWETTSLYRQLFGSCAWIYIGRDNPTTIPEEIWPCPPTGLKPLISDDELSILGWEWTTSGGNTRHLAPWELLLTSQFNPNGSVFGLSSVASTFQSISADFRAMAAQDSLFKNGAIPAGLLSTEQPMTDVQSQQIMERWDSRHQGGHKQGKTAIVHSGLKFQTIQPSNADLQILELHNSTREDIAAAFDVPWELMGFGKATFDNFDQAQLFFYNNTLIPRMNYLAEMVTEKLLSEVSGGRWRGRFDTSNVLVLQEKINEKVATGKILWDMGTPLDEINRRLALKLSLDEVAGTDTPFLPFSVAPATGPAQALEPVDGIDLDPADPAVLLPTGQSVEVSEEAVLNGAQITAATSIVTQVALGELPRDAGIGQLQVLFNLSTEQAELIMGSAGTSAFTPATAQPVAPAPTGEASAPVKIQKGHLDSKDNREQYWHVYFKRVTDPIERRMNARMRREFGIQRRDVLGALDNFSDPATVEKAEGDPPLSSNSDLGLDIDQWDVDTKAALSPLISQTVTLSGGELTANFGLVFDASQPQWAQLVRERTLALSEITATTARDVRSIIANGIEEGDTIATISAAIRKKFNEFTRSRAQMIAITETNGAASETRAETFKDNGVPITQWITARDSHVRPTHQAQDGLTRPVGALFPNGLAEPLDPRGRASEVINCRCVAVPVFED